MSKLIDLTGQRFGRLTVVERAENTAEGKARWLCKCDCGEQVRVRAESLRSGGTRSCGCLKHDNRTVDMIGQRFGRLTAISRVVSAEKGKGAYFLCRCDCGKEITTKGASLRSGHTKSCGCITRERVKELGQARSIDLTGERFGRLTVLFRIVQGKPGDIVWRCKCDCGKKVDVRASLLRRGDTRSCGCLQRELLSTASITHGGRKSRLYRIWCSMKSRCNNPKVKSYKDYGHQQTSCIKADYPINSRCRA